MLPNDPVMLLSFINTQLRDNYKSLADFCKAYMVELESISDKLASIDYFYDETTNQFN